ncbi:MAG: tRNA preQ1(34) S-adenosylmethionine ribosyltransferase-isomerase QueA [Zoogloeaceae bacterium]|jgi:S-adenosylmethionine:tRNA ribosyltransferase-isomerase|nr:tRNA preQ1(34) S-adenosylmethionine ribosyltransferase-isomerase QueA [Zoogloeaceae bacterium]
MKPFIATSPRLTSLTVDDFDFALPEALIAQHPASERAASRLLRVDAAGFSDLRFVDLPRLLNPGDLLVMNDTKVIKARFFGQKDTGGRVEVMLERILDARRALAQVRAGKAPKAGCRLELAEAFSVRVTKRQDDFFLLTLETETGDFWSLAETHGRLPLPPYIRHAPSAEDEARYQTLYARAPGAVAAPTAGLHFDADLLERIAASGIRTTCLTLHVGAGTYQPVRVDRIHEHRMHKECFVLSEETAAAIRQTRAAGGRVVAVGTTALRALESAACGHGEVRAGRGETAIFITPGFDFQVVDRLITNFHLPRSTLLMLVSAFAGMERIRAAYAHAIAREYRFFSYGDAMLLTRAKAG